MITDRAGAMNPSDREDFVLEPESVRFRRDGEGTVWLGGNGQGEQAVASVMSVFPLTRPLGMVSLRDPDGDEIGILQDVRKLDADSRRIVQEELERSYFMPRITDIESIKETLNVVAWRVQTDKGPRDFDVRGVRRHVRRLGPRQLVIKDVDGNRYEVFDWMTLPQHAQKLLEPYI